MTRKRKETRWGRTLGWWAFALIIVIVLIAYPTEFRWGRWVYGLIWGLLTSGGIYIFRGFFEKGINDQEKYNW